MGTNQSVQDAGRSEHLGRYITVTTVISGLEETKTIHLDPTTTTIEASTFDGYDKQTITAVVLSEGIETIGKETFYGCRNLVSVTSKKSVTTIGDYAFHGCLKLASVELGDLVTTIGNGAFYHCQSLNSITFLDSVETIGECAFERCVNLTSITFSDSLKTIGRAAFYSCLSLISLTFRDSVTTTIDYLTFYNCEKLEKIYIKAGDEETLEGIKVLLPKHLRDLAQPLPRKKSARSAIIHDEALVEGRSVASAQSSLFAKKSSNDEPGEDATSSLSHQRK